MLRRIIRMALALCALALFARLALPQATQTSPAPSKAQSTPIGKTDKVDINSASKGQLDALPGIGAEYSQKIIDGRPYDKTHDLVSRKIIPQSTYDKIKNQIIAHKHSDVE